MGRRDVSYAARTSVGTDRSKTELERLLMKNGADQFGYMNDSTGVMIAFRMHSRHVRLLMPIPPLSEFRTVAAHEQVKRSRWRALILIVKAKFEAIRSGVSTFEREFLADIVLPDGSSVHEFLAPQIEEAYSNGAMPKSLMLALPAGEPA